MATGVHEPDRGAYPLGRYRGVGTAARAKSVAVPVSPAAGKESTHGTTERTHLVNALMQEAHLMMGVLEKAMQGERIEESHPTLHGAHHPQGQYSLEEEHKAWGKVLRALTDMQTELEQIAQSEHQRIAQ
jgi:hypothetical protein